MIILCELSFKKYPLTTHINMCNPSKKNTFLDQLNLINPICFCKSRQENVKNILSKKNESMKNESNTADKLSSLSSFGFCDILCNLNI